MSSIVIPACDTTKTCARLLHHLLFSIQEGGYKDKVFVCFDGTDRFFVNYFTNKFPFIYPIHNANKNLGFALNANIGIHTAMTQNPGEGVFLVNMDTVLPSSEYLYQIKNAGIASPTQIDLMPGKDGVGPGVSVDNLNIYNASYLTTPENKTRLVGFCLWISWPVLEKVGILDDGFIASFEDDDYCARTLLAGFPVESYNIVVQHYTKSRSKEVVTTTTGAYDSNRLYTSEYRFKLKWGIPEYVTHHGDGDIYGPKRPSYNEWIQYAYEWKDSMRIELQGVRMNG